MGKDRDRGGERGGERGHRGDRDDSRGRGNSREKRGGGGGQRGGRGGGGGGLAFTPYVPKFLRDMGGLGQAPEGSIAGRRKAMDAKFAKDDGGEASPDEEEPANYEALAARIAESGGTIVQAEDARAFKKSRRSGDGSAAPDAAGASKTPAAPPAVAPEEELLQVDESGRAKVKFVAVDPSKVAERRAKAGAAGARGGPAVRNAKLLSFGGDGDDEG